jgi:hypothetical protein
MDTIHQFGMQLIYEYIPIQNPGSGYIIYWDTICDLYDTRSR